MAAYGMRMMAGLLLALAICGAAPAATPAGAPGGHLVVIGGALRPDNAEVWQRIVDLAGGAGAKIAVLPCAAGQPMRAGANIATSLQRYGARPFVVPLAVRLDGADYRRMADDEDVAQSIRSAGAVYFSGGDQRLITQALVRPDGSRSKVLQAVWELYQRGGTIAGSSAGAAIMSATMFADAPTVLATLQQGVSDGKDIAPGLGFIGADVFVDQHLLVRGRFARMLPVMLKKGYRLGLGVDENTAVVVSPERKLEVIGYKGAILLDLGGATSAAGPFNVSNASISYIDRGDGFDLASGQFMPGPGKRDGALDVQRPFVTGPVYSNDILGNTAVVDLMERLIDSDQADAVGLALGDPRAPAPGQGFVFRFSRTEGSRGYLSNVAQAYSVLKLRLDVLPR